MNYLSVENLAKSYGIQVLFEGVNFGIEKGQKMALVAKNGSGKTTLMRILAGLDEPDSGQVVFRKGIKISYLDQNPVFTKGASIREIVNDPDLECVKAIRHYEACMSDPNKADQFQDALDEMERLGAWDFESRMEQILGKLKITDLEKQVDQLSGGQKKRVALAKILIEEPDFIILDEPTNHLDLEMIEWLQEYLQKQNVTLFMVTHDRYFLDAVCNVILELDNQTIYRYKGNYAYYLEKKSEREESLEVSVGKAKNLMKKELEWIRRQPKARGTKSKARIDNFSNIKADASQKVDKEKVELEIQVKRLGGKILELHKISKSYGDLPIVNFFDYNFQRKERVGIIGKNGVGKSTFLNMLTGAELPDTGKVVKGDTVKFGYYRQDGMKLKEDKRVIEVVKDIAEVIPLSKGRKLTASQMLERFLFDKNAQWSLVSKLSGGERKRLYLLTLLMANPNFLILDEPTNDFDLVTLNVLEDFLDAYEGCIVMVSHDRYFMDRLVDHLFVFEGEGVIKDFPGNYTDYREYEKSNKKVAVKTESVVQKEEPKKEVIVEVDKDTPKKLSYQEKKEYESLEGEIEKLEEEKENIMAKFASGEIAADEMEQSSIKLGELEKFIADKTNRWMELAERA